VLQCAAVCCSVLQCVVVCCSVLQCVAMCCSVLPSVVVYVVHSSRGANNASPNAVMYTWFSLTNRCTATH